MNTRTTMSWAVGALLLAQLPACTPIQIQNTSGKDYLARAADRLSDQEANAKSEEKLRDVLRQVAAVEPALSLPARFGLARIDHRRRGGDLSIIPEGEYLIWQALAGKLDSGTGTFVTVSPLVAKLTSRAVNDVAASADGNERLDDTLSAIDRVRIAAARQHIDYVLVYQVNSSHETNRNAFAVTDLTILGGAIFPSREVDADATAQALLLDVMNGYPYAVIEGRAKEKAWSPWWYADHNAKLAANTAENRAVGDLVANVGEMILGVRKRQSTE